MTVHRRVSALGRSLPQVAALGRPVLVVDDGSPKQEADAIQALVRSVGAKYLLVPENRGLSSAMNIGLSYWLADKSVDWVAYFQDDVDVDPDAVLACSAVGNASTYPLVTCHDSAYHPCKSTSIVNSISVKMKPSCAAVHMHAHCDYWQSVMPIPTVRLGAPKRIPGRPRGVGSNADWWVVNNAPNALRKRGLWVACIPNLVRTFFWERKDSSWGNMLPKGEEPPLSKAAIRKWRSST